MSKNQKQAPQPDQNENKNQEETINLTTNTTGEPVTTVDVKIKIPKYLFSFVGILHMLIIVRFYFVLLWNRRAFNLNSFLKVFLVCCWISISWAQKNGSPNSIINLLFKYNLLTFQEVFLFCAVAANIIEIVVLSFQLFLIKKKLKTIRFTLIVSKLSLKSYLIIFFFNFFF